MLPIKSKKLKEPPPNENEKTGDKSIVTSVHGIMDAEFPILSILNKQLSRSAKHVESPPKRMGIQTTSSKYLPFMNKEVKTIKIQMPVLGLERAVVYPKTRGKPIKIQLQKFKKVRIPTASGTTVSLFNTKRKRNKKNQNNTQDKNYDSKRIKVQTAKGKNKETDKKVWKKDIKGSESKKPIFESAFLQMDKAKSKKNVQEIDPIYKSFEKQSKLVSDKTLLSLEKQATEILQRYDQHSVIEEEQSNQEISLKKSRELLFKTEDEIVKQLLNLNPETVKKEPVSLTEQPVPIETDAIISKKQTASSLKDNALTSDVQGSQSQTNSQPVVLKRSSQGSRIPKLKRITKIVKKPKISNSKQLQQETLHDSKGKASRASLGSTSTLKSLKRHKSISKSSVSRSSNRLGLTGGPKLESISKTSQKAPSSSKSTHKYSKMDIDYIGQRLSHDSIRKIPEDRKSLRESKVSSKQIKEIKDMLEGVPLSDRKLVRPRKSVKKE